MSAGMNPTILAQAIQAALEKAEKNTTDRTLAQEELAQDLANAIILEVKKASVTSTLQPGTGKATYAGSGTVVDLVTLITKSTLIS